MFKDSFKGEKLPVYFFSLAVLAELQLMGRIWKTALRQFLKFILDHDVIAFILCLCFFITLALHLSILRLFIDRTDRSFINF